jgi:hypothetical protein
METATRGIQNGETRMTKEEEQLDLVLNNFDFGRVRKAMVALDWRWANKGIPTLGDLYNEAERLLIKAQEEKCTIATGGLVAMGTKSGVLSLSFVVEEVVVLKQELL